MKLTFLGAAGTVTGSKYLLEFQDKKILIDCEIGLSDGAIELLSAIEGDEISLSHLEKLPVTEGAPF